MKNKKSSDKKKESIIKKKKKIKLEKSHQSVKKYCDQTQRDVYIDSNT